MPVFSHSLDPFRTFGSHHRKDHHMQDYRNTLNHQGQICEKFCCKQCNVRLQIVTVALTTVTRGTDNEQISSEAYCLSVFCHFINILCRCTRHAVGDMEPAESRTLHR